MEPRGSQRWCLRRVTRGVIASLALGAGVAAPVAQERDGSAIALTHVSVVDVTTGARLANRTVLISNGRIRSIQLSSETLPNDGTRVITASGKFLIPGLWDMHVHTLSREIDFPLAIAHGVTGIRDMGGTSEYPPPGNWSIRWDSLRTWRNQVRAGAILGPRIVAAGVALDGPRPYWPQTLSLRTPTAAVHAIDSLAREGVDFIKVYAALPRPIYLAIAQRSRARRLPFSGHPSDFVRLDEAADEGQASFEHANSLERLYDDRRAFDVAVRAMLRNGSAFDPTLITLWAAVNRQGPRVGSDTYRAFVPARIHAVWDTRLGATPSAQNRAALQRSYRTWREIVRSLHGRGVKLLVGSDAWNPYTVPGASLHDELALLVREGLQPHDVLRAATLGAAQFLGTADSLGTIAPGKIADLVLLDGDPLIDIRNVRRVSAVIVNGRLLERRVLDSLLTVAKRAAIR